ncbi:zinc finger protein 454-like isoform X4 [Periplaneta americana]|uniref:zinc finger protein 454-like isoform X4 n=1 Tax=Periplaneta americana TaxID=6978 RepID=UPI0037E8E190
MDLIKTEPMTDPLAMQTSNDIDVEEKNLVSQDLHITVVEEEQVNSCKMKFEEIIMPNNFLVVKCEPEEESDTAVKGELKLEVEAEQDQVLSESIAVTESSTPSSECDGVGCEGDVGATLSSVFVEKPAPQRAMGCCNYDKVFATENISKTKFRSHRPHSSMRSEAGDNSYKCGVCGKVLSAIRSLKCHLRTHTGEKPFKCHVCEKCFSESSSLRKHLRVHTGEKPFSCDVCGLCFSQSVNLKRHVRLHTS